MCCFRSEILNMFCQVDCEYVTLYVFLSYVITALLCASTQQQYVYGITKTLDKEVTTT